MSKQTRSRLLKMRVLVAVYGYGLETALVLVAGDGLAGERVRSLLLPYVGKIPDCPQMRAVEAITKALAAAAPVPKHSKKVQAS